MKTIRILGLAVAAAAVALLLSMSHASGQPVAGGYYAGAVTGGGTVDFTVSGDGSQVVGFTAYDVPGDVCEFTGPNPFPTPLDIEGDSFETSIPGLLELSGSFPSQGTAAGTLSISITYPFACTTGTLNWTATTTTPSPAPVGGIAELPDVSESAACGYAALAGLAAAALVALSAGAWYARRRWLS
jgi:hypothetical protein